jgi:hypothetical protein
LPYSKPRHGVAIAQSRPKPWWRLFSLLGLTFSAALLPSCSSLQRPDLSAATIAASNRDAFQGIRYPANEAPSGRQATPVLGSASYAVLALSGGGPDGAYGAGLLAGWTKTGTRPTFDVVTGVSTGALMASFAFLGPSQDARLQDIYTNDNIRTLLKEGSPLRLLSGPSVYRNKSLKKLIALNVDDELLEAIAAEHRRGRRLYVATANLDAQAMVIWDMGEIASRLTPESKALFRQILLSAASVQLAFPPELMSDYSNPRSIPEAHGDATLFAHIYAGPELFPVEDCKSGARRCDLYVIVHNKTIAEPQTLKFKATAVIKRSLETIVKANLNTRLLATNQMAQAQGVAFHVAYLDVPFPGVSPINFDVDYMRMIYDLGVIAGQRDETWLRAPPKDK